MEMTDKVAINNLCAWPLYFKRANGVGDIRVPANAKNFMLLDVAEVQTQIQLGNPLFVGVGGNQGDHARLYIVNDEQRKALLGIEDDNTEEVVLNLDTVKELLSIRRKDDFQKRLEALVTTPAEKRMIVQIAKEAGGDDVAAWKMDAINAIADENAV